eukprot:6689832-Prymnesium_polylepis.1
MLAPESHSPRRKNSELSSFLLHQPEAVDPRVSAGPASALGVSSTRPVKDGLWRIRKYSRSASDARA